MSVEVGDGSLGSFLCSLESGSIRVARRVSIGVRSAVLGPGLFPLGSLVIITLVSWMW